MSNGLPFTYKAPPPSTALFQENSTFCKTAAGSASVVALTQLTTLDMTANAITSLTPRMQNSISLIPTSFGPTTTPSIAAERPVGAALRRLLLSSSEFCSVFTRNPNGLRFALLAANGSTQMVRAATIGQ